MSTAVVGCSAAANQAADQLGPKALARCGARGTPVTIAKLVRVFRKNGITLEINQKTCVESERVDADATNAGVNGLQQSNETKRREGVVLCSVNFHSSDRSVRTVKYDTDKQTYVDVLNVNCAVFPYDAARKKSPVARVRRALEAVVRATPRKG